MIQRPQTLLLGLIIILMLISLFLPNWKKTSTDGNQSAVQTSYSLEHTVIRDGKPETTPHGRKYLAVMILTVAALAGFSISRFKTRLTQMKIGFAISLSLAATLATMMMGIRKGEGLFDLTREGQLQAGFYLLFVALFANIVSNRLIRKDENLVRSMDRIR